MKEQTLERLSGTKNDKDPPLALAILGHLVVLPLCLVLLLLLPSVAPRARLLGVASARPRVHSLYVRRPAFQVSSHV